MAPLLLVVCLLFSAPAVAQQTDARQSADTALETGRSFRRQGKNEPAAAHYREAVAHATAAGDPRRELVATIELGGALAGMSRYVEATSALDRAEGLWNRDRDPELAARLWLERGAVAMYRGENGEALVHYHRALDFAVQAESPALQAPLLGNIGQTHTRLHRYAEALTFYQRALETAPQAPSRVNTLVAIGICQYELNRFRDAAATFEDARQAAIELGNVRLEAWAIGELGLAVWKADQDVPRALAYLDQSVRLLEQVNDPHNALVFLENKANVYRDQGRYRDALDLYRTVEAKTRAIAGLKPNANIYKGIGQCLAGLGRLDEAETMFAKSITDAAAAGDTKRVWQSNYELARLYRRQDRRSEAEQAYRKAIGAIEIVRQSLGVEGFKADYFEDKVRVYEEYIDLVLGEPADEAAIVQAFEIGERARARAFLDSLTELSASVEQTLPAEVRQQEKTILSEISALQAEMRRAEATPELVSLLREKEKALDDFYVRVRSDHPRFQQMRYAQPASVAEVQRALRPGEGLLEFAVGDQASHAWLVRSDSVAYWDLPGRGTLEGAVQQALSQLVQPTSPLPNLNAAAAVLLQGMPVADMPASLIVVPSGILYYFPLEVLPAGSAGAPLGTLTRISYMPSAAVLIHSRGAAPRPRGGRLLVVGDADYRNGAASAERTFNLQALGALPHTRREAIAIRSRFGRLSSTMLLGGEATETAFKKQPLSRFSVIHLATHGWIDPSAPARSGLVFGMDAGAEDGLLQVREILQLPLQASLVTLSACQSALGKLTTGEGMVGLTRAFFYAGAESVVASLWNVNDEATAEFMSFFYEALSGGASKAEALQAAKIRLRADARYAHPYYWAPYVLIGEASNGVAFPGTWLPAGAALGVVFALAGVLVAYRKMRYRRISNSAHADAPTS